MRINGEEHNDLCVGIDLGTTNSVLATINLRGNGDVVSRVVELPRAVDMYTGASGSRKCQSKRRSTLPSCVFYDEENNYEPMVGDFAKQMYNIRPGLTAKSIKSQMGKARAEGLAEEVPDKTPARISARILNHMLSTAGKIYRTDINDAVITVPANFDSAMCQATRAAAEMAGVQVKNSDGSERAVLLSEPNAVIYDFINQVRNGEISDHIIDLSTQKNVLVFDLGGGTLDITLHEIIRRSDCQDILRVNEIATNRYTLLGGDDFDKKLAEAMYDRYLKQYAHHGNVIDKIKRNKTAVMAQLQSYAEELKLQVSLGSEEGLDNDWSSGDWDTDEESYDVGGIISVTGYAYDDSFTKQEIEEIFSCFMGKNLTFDSYKNADFEGDSTNIIHPILDVLKKASEKLGEENLSVDAVLMNGGMSKFYMVVNRVKEFFGLDPIIATDPDLAVARGAAVYHYYLHKYEALQADMIKTGISSSGEYEDSSDAKHQTREAAVRNAVAAEVGLEIGRQILNDSLYMELKGNKKLEIAPAGAELPYDSEWQTGYWLAAGTNSFEIPIFGLNLDNSYRYMANGRMEFKNEYPDGVYVVFKIHLNQDKTIEMEAWTSEDEDGLSKQEQGTTSIVLGSYVAPVGMARTVNAAGRRVEAPKALTVPIPAARRNLINVSVAFRELEKYCNRFEQPGRKNGGFSKLIRKMVTDIIMAGNRADVLDMLMTEFKFMDNYRTEYKIRLFIIGRRLAGCMDEKQKKIMAGACMEELRNPSTFFYSNLSYVNSQIQAIYTLGLCASRSQLVELERYHNRKYFQEALLYTHARTKSSVEWIYEVFKGDLRMNKAVTCTHLGQSMFAMALAMYNDGSHAECCISKNEIVDIICNLINQKALTRASMHTAVLGIGWICDQRYENDLLPEVLEKAKDTIQNMPVLYPLETNHMTALRGMVMKILSGEALTVAEEKLLLEQLNK